MPTLINPSIFRAYDIRGTAEPTAQKPQPDLTPETAKLIGLGTGTYLQRKYSARNIIVGRDNRLHSAALQQAFIEGLRETGMDVMDAGLATSPMIYFASCHYGSDTAAVITASHNPKQDNGIKIVQKHAHSVDDLELQEIRRIIEAEDFIRSVTPGSLTTLTTVSADYRQKILSVTKLHNSPTRPLRVVLDAGNGVTGAFAPDIFRAIGCEVTELYCDLDGNFPNHEANPEHAKNMVALGEKVREIGADLGIGFDGDGDRVGIVDEKGQHYSAEFPIMLIARDLLAAHPGEKIIHDVKVCQSVIDDILAHRGQPIMSRVGHSYIERRMHSEQATFAGEKSGHLFFGQLHFDYYGFDDGIFAGVKIVEALSKTTLSFSEIFADIHVNPNIPELKLYCPDERKEPIIEALRNHFVPLYDCITLDGVRLQFPDGAWILARYSNTTPYITLYAEAPTETRLEEIKELIFTELRHFPEVKLP